MSLIIRFLTIAFVQAATGFSLPGQNTPPVLTLNRNWKIPENEVVGTRIETARAQDAEENPLIFDIKPSEYIDGSRFFRIDPHSGVIYLNSSLQGEAGSQYYLFVTAKDEEFESKTEVFVDVVSSSSSSGGKGAMSTIRPLSVPPMVTTPTSPPQMMAIKPTLTLETTDGDSINVIETERETGNGSGDFPLASLPVLSNDDDGDKTTQHVALAMLAVVMIFAIPLAMFGIRFIRRNKSDDMNLQDLKKGNDLTLSSSGLSSASIRTSASQDNELVASAVQRAESNKYETAEWENTETRNKEVIGNGDVKRSSNISSGDGSGSWEYPRHHLKIFGILGEGCFGQVWKCEGQDVAGLPGTMIVAVKTLKDLAGEREKKDLVSELEVMKMLDPHPNIVRLLGCCTEKDPLFVIMEYVPYGKLQTYLRNSRAEHYYGNLHGSSQHLTSNDLTSFAHHVARGMEYLTSKGIIHRDLAARNVLVGNDKTCKVADFGFARDVIINRVYERKSEGRLPIRWMAPESLYDNIFSSKTDVWSFGVLLWEIVTLGSTPYPGMAASDVIKKIRDGYRLEKPEHCKRELYNIMYYCWDNDSKERPSFAELSRTLENLLLGDVEYIELERFPEHAYYNMVSLSGEKL